MNYIFFFCKSEINHNVLVHTHTLLRQKMMEKNEYCERHIHNVVFMHIDADERKLCNFFFVLYFIFFFFIPFLFSPTKFHGVSHSYKSNLSFVINSISWFVVLCTLPLFTHTYRHTYTHKSICMFVQAKQQSGYNNNNTTKNVYFIHS